MTGHDSNCINHLDFTKINDEQKEIIAQHNSVQKKETTKIRKSPNKILQELKE